MSWEEIKYACGHTGTQQLYGSRKSRDNKIKWLGEMVDCPECRAKARHEAAVIFESSYGMPLPELKGSPKQIAWAESIRKDRLPLIDEEFNRQIKTLEEAQDPDESKVHPNIVRRAKAENISFREALIEYTEDVRDEIHNQASAAWWIDSRGVMVKYLVVKSVVDAYQK